MHTVAALVAPGGPRELRRARAQRAAPADQRRAEEDTTERYNARLLRAVATVHLQSIAPGENRATLPPSYMSLR